MLAGISTDCYIETERTSVVAIELTLIERSL